MSSGKSAAAEGVGSPPPPFPAAARRRSSGGGGLSSNPPAAAVEEHFYQLGYQVARNPHLTMIFCLIAAILVSGGLSAFRFENRVSRLWLPRSSTYHGHRRWVDDHHPADARAQEAILRHDRNVLTREAMLLLLDIHENVRGIEVRKHNLTWEDICLRIPVGDLDGRWDQLVQDLSSGVRSGGRPNLTVVPFPAVAEDKELRCLFQRTLPRKCLVRSVLEIWDFDRDAISGLTERDIVDAVNTADTSRTFGYRVNFTDLLGSVTRNSTGHVVSARSALTRWYGSVDKARDLRGEDGGGGRRRDLVEARADRAVLDWEDEFVGGVRDLAKDIHYFTHGRFRLKVRAERSLNDENEDAVRDDAPLIGFSFVVMFLYTVVMLGRFSWVEQRCYLTFAGLLGVVLGLTIGMSVCQSFGLVFSPLHLTLPYLCLGIGIGDMFVIVQCWHNLPSEPWVSEETLSKRMGRTMRSAGTTLTVSMLTGFFAFVVGVFTDIPGTQSFSLHCAACVASVHLVQATWFVAFFALDQQRVESRRDGCFPCYVQHPLTEPLGGAEDEFGRHLMETLADTLENPMTKISILVASVALLGAGVSGCVLIGTEFDVAGNLPWDSYARKELKLRHADFEEGDWEAHLFTGKMPVPPEDAFAHLDNIARDVQAWERNGTILKEFECWWCDFKEYLSEKRNLTRWQDAYERGDLDSLLSDFLFSARGLRHQRNFVFQGVLRCNRPLPNISATRMPYRYLRYDSQFESAHRRQRLDHAVHQDKILKKTFSFSTAHMAWEIDEAMGWYLGQSLALALAAVAVVLQVFLADPAAAAVVFLCDALVLTETVGILHFWRGSVNVYSVAFATAIAGLGASCPATVSLAFLQAKGSSVERVRSGLVSMGVPVLNSAFTLFFSVLVLSLAFIDPFVYFFKMFVLMLSLSLFHGLLLLPVLLGMSGMEVEDDAGERSPLATGLSSMMGTTAAAAGAGKRRWP